VVVADFVAQHGVDGLFMCTMMSGALLVVFDATGTGTAVKFIPRPVVVGPDNICESGLDALARAKAA
jgi:SulP family sulfate permease